MFGRGGGSTAKIADYCSCYRFRIFTSFGRGRRDDGTPRAMTARRDGRTFSAGASAEPPAERANRPFIAARRQRTRRDDRWRPRGVAMVMRQALDASAPRLGFSGRFERGRREGFALFPPVLNLPDTSHVTTVGDNFLEINSKELPTFEK